MIVIKRDGSSVQFDRSKIERGVLAAFNASGEMQISEVDSIPGVVIISSLVVTRRVEVKSF